MTKLQRIAIGCFLACFVLQGIGLFAMHAVSAWSRGTKMLDGGVAERYLDYSTSALQTPAFMSVILFAVAAIIMCVSPIWTLKKTGTGNIKTVDLFRFIFPFLGILLGCILTADVCGLYAGYQYALSYERNFSFVPFEDRARIAISNYNVTLAFAQCSIALSSFIVILRKAIAAQQQAESNTSLPGN